MSKRITAVALAVLMFALALPASAQIQATSVEVRGTVASENASAGGIDLTTLPPSINWSAQSFAGFYYDSKDNLGTEVLDINTNVTDSGGAFSTSGRRIPKSSMTYTTTGQAKLLKVVDQKFPGNISSAIAAGLEQAGTSKGFENGYYTILGWQAQPYVALNGKVDYLAQLIIEQGTSTAEKKTLQVGETWDVGGGWTVTANSIDAKATPRQVWLTLNKDGVKKDDKVLTVNGIYTFTEKSLAGQTDVPVFLTYVDSVFAGATSDMVQLRYTWAISESVTHVSSSDTYGVFKNANVAGKTLSLKNDDTALTLTRDSTQDLMGNMKFLVADNETLRFYPKVDYLIGGGNITPTATAGAPVATATGTPTNVTVTPTVPSVTPAGTVRPPVETPVATPTPTPRTSGFEAGIAIAGLLAVAFLVLRQRK